VIRVSEFHLPEDRVAVCRLPLFYEDFLNNSNDSALDDELRQYPPLTDSYGLGHLQ
jgi:hypothetical protein